MGTCYGAIIEATLNDTARYYIEPRAVISNQLPNTNNRFRWYITAWNDIVRGTYNSQDIWVAGRPEGVSVSTDGNGWSHTDRSQKADLLL